MTTLKKETFANHIQRIQANHVFFKKIFKKEKKSDFFPQKRGTLLSFHTSSKSSLTFFVSSCTVSLQTVRSMMDSTNYQNNRKA